VWCGRLDAEQCTGPVLSALLGHGTTFRWFHKNLSDRTQAIILYSVRPCVHIAPFFDRKPLISIERERAYACVLWPPGENSNKLFSERIGLFVWPLQALRVENIVILMDVLMLSYIGAIG